LVEELIMPSIRNILIFVSIAAAMVVSYVVFIKSDEPVDNLVVSPAEVLPDAISGDEAVPVSLDDAIMAEDFLNLLLSVKNIKLDDAIFREVAWSNLVDSSIELVPSGDEGRPNPFAPLGVDVLSPTPVEAFPPAPVAPAPAPTGPLPDPSLNAPPAPGAL
jgi:hypothetical protein